MRPLRPVLPLTLVAAIAFALAPSAPVAHAAPDQASIMQDDDLLLYRSDGVRVRTLGQMRKLGTDAVRATLLWRVAAEGANLTDAEIARLKTDAQRRRARNQRKRFVANNPKTYPTRNWDRYDNLVREASKLGMRVIFSVTGPGPMFAHAKAPASQRVNAATYKPNAKEFGAFVQAVGRRYSGQYKDENAGRVKLGRITAWSLWNEPNQAGWLTPQWESRQGQVIPASPILYRELYREGRAALERAGHAGDTILLGETAPSGSAGRGPRAHVRPVPFLRELACVGPNGAPYAGPDATRRGCESFATLGPLKASGYAHHPYTKKVAPTKPPKSPEDINIGNIGALGTTLDTIAAQSGGRIQANMPIFLTEFGYESNPPDPRNGIPTARQALFNQLAEFLAYNQPRVKATTQFLLRDSPPLKKYAKGSRLYYFTYQSGLYTQTGKAKPAAIGYAMPFVVYPGAAGTVGFWTQARFRPNGAGDSVVLQWRATKQAPWQTIGGPIKTDLRGFATGPRPRPGPAGEYRAAIVDPANGRVSFSSLSASL